MDRGEISITGTELIVGEVKAQSMLAGQLTACKVNSVVNPLTAKKECHGFNGRHGTVTAHLNFVPDLF